MLHKVISGKGRKTRLHDEKNNFVGWPKLITHGSQATVTGLARVLLGYRPELPWISYDAIAYLKQFLTPDSRVLEFGSGMSTIWYAKHAGQVCSVESCHLWYQKIKDVLQEKQINNANYQYIEDQTAYTHFMANDEQGFDLVMVDGEYRSACIANAVSLVRPGGILYLDNSDKHSTPEGGDTRLAEERALAFAKQKNATITYFTDFAPTQLFVQQGLMIQTPNG